MLPRTRQESHPALKSHHTLLVSHRTDYNNPLITFLNVFMVLRQHSLLVVFKTWLKVSSQILITTWSQAEDLIIRLNLHYYKVSHSKNSYLLVNFFNLSFSLNSAFTFLVVLISINFLVLLIFTSQSVLFSCISQHVHVWPANILTNPNTDSLSGFVLILKFS